MVLGENKYFGSGRCGQGLELPDVNLGLGRQAGDGRGVLCMCLESGVGRASWLFEEGNHLHHHPPTPPTQSIKGKSKM